MNAAVIPILFIILVALILFLKTLCDTMKPARKNQMTVLALIPVHYGVQINNGDDLKLSRCDRLNGSDQNDRNESRL